MTIALARQILSQESTDAAVQLVFDHEDQLLWDEYGDEVERFNAIAAAYPGIPAAAIEGEESDVRMSYKGATVQVPLEFDREDKLRAVYTLSQLAKADIEFRMVRATSGNSEQGFMVLPPPHWHELEREFGTDAVSRRFLSLAPDWNAFTQEAFAENENDMSPQELAVKRFAEAVLAEASKVVPCEVARGCDEYNYVEVTLVTETNRERDRLFRDVVFKSALKRLVPTLRAHGLLAKCVVIESHETANERWHGLFLEAQMRASSPHIWFNRGPGDGQPSWRRAVGALARFIR